MIDSPTRSAQTRLTPRCHRLARRADRERPRRRAGSRPPVDRLDAEQRAARPLSWPAPRKPDEADDLAGVDAGNRSGRPRRCEPASSASRGAPCALGGPAEDLRRLAADDQQDRLVGRRLRDDALAGDLAVAQHDHAVGDLEHLVEPVRDVDHADAAARAGAAAREQPRDLVGGQARGRLVEHQHFGVGGERARDGDQRFLGAAEVSGCAGRGRCRRRALASARAARLRAAVPVDHAEPARNSRASGRCSRSTVIQSIRPRSWWMKEIGMRLTVCGHVGAAVADRCPRPRHRRRRGF